MLENIRISETEKNNELIKKIEYLEFENQCLLAQNNYMKENIKKYNLSEKKEKRNLLIMKIKNKIWRK